MEPAPLIVSTVPSSDHVQSPVVPLVAALAVIENNPIGQTDIINSTVKRIDKHLFIFLLPLLKYLFL